jgi:hypothetical protein
VTNPAAFWIEALPWARTAAADTGLFVSLVLAQWADETEYGGPDWSEFRNPGNVGDPAAGGQTTFPTLQAGVNEYINLMNTSPQFGPRIKQGATPQTQAILLGTAHPVWALGGYNDGNGPGSALISIISDYNLTQYDSAPPSPVPEDDDMKYIICNPAPGQPTWLVEGSWKVEIPDEASVWCWAAAGALVENGLTQDQLDLIPTV